MNEKSTEQPLATAAPRLYAQKAQEIVRDFDRLQDRVQALAAEVDECRAPAVLHLSHELLDLQHKAKLIVQLLAMT